MKYLLVACAILCFTRVQWGNAANAPSTEKRPVADEYFGTKITDDYRWLEDSKNPEVESWTKAQDSATRAYLAKLPHVAEFQKRLTKWANATSPNYWELKFAGNQFFAMKVQPPKEQPLLVVVESPRNLKSERVLLDPNKLDKTGKTTIDFFSPSLDGKYVAVSISSAGTESGTVHIFEVASGKELPDQLPRVNGATAGGSLAWNKGGTGFFYTRYPASGERAAADLDFYQQIYFHRLGSAVAEDTYSAGKDFPRIAEIKLATSRDGETVLATVANGDGGEFAHYVSPANGTGDWKQITAFSDKIVGAELGRHKDLYLLSRNGAQRGKILHLPLQDPQLSLAKELVPESEVVISECLATGSHLYVQGMLGGPSQISVYDLNGGLIGKAHTGAVASLSGLTDTAGDEVFFKKQTFLNPDAWFGLDAVKSPKLEPTKTAMAVKSPVSFADTEVAREIAVSKDGTKVPINLIFKKGLKRNGKNPTLLYAYGGYGMSMSPRFRADLRLWVDHGGVYALANIRGGGEFGEEWHKSGMLTKKQNVFDDFIGCAEYLIREKITSPEHLAIEGGSNGGLLMGAVLTQRPELFKTVVSHVGIYDSLRVELAPNGAFNVTEFGTVKEEAQFKALYAYSPYHHVTDGTKYPPVLLLTGANDNRVDPYHSKKMAARLQSVMGAAYLRVSFSAGHGIGSGRSERIAQQADVYAFLFSQLGMK